MDDEDDDMSGTLSKRSKNVHITVPGPLLEDDEEESQGSSGSPATSPTKETEEVQNVTKGVKEVELNEKEKKDAEDVSEASDNAESSQKVNGTTTEAPATAPAEKVSNETSEAPKDSSESEEPQSEKSEKVQDEASSAVPTAPIPRSDSTSAPEIKNPLPTPTKEKEVEIGFTKADRPIKPLKRSRKADLNGATPEPTLVGKKVNGEAKIANGTNGAAVEEPVAVAL